MANKSVWEKQELEDEVTSLQESSDQYSEFSDILSSNPTMLRIKEIAKRVAGTDVPVLILGESGVGKEILAHFIHVQSDQRDQPFVKVNCAALPHDLLESELFGFERGAFTGAVHDKPGKFELAGKGSILLDEIADMSPALQAKILQVLQDGEVTRLGSKRTLRSEARVLAATNHRLTESVSKGQFREDLYFRLNVVRFEIPPLRERQEDIPLLCSYFVQKYRERYKSLVQYLPQQVMEEFLRYHWPGNVRQLENAIRHYLILPDPQFTMAELEDSAPTVEVSHPSHPESLPLKELSARAAELVEREEVLRVLGETGWNRKEAAQHLGICYKALLNKLKKWQIGSHRKRSRGAAAGI